MRARLPIALAAAALLAACGSGGGGSGQPSSDPNNPDPNPGPGPGPDPQAADTVLQCARDFLGGYVASGTRSEAIPPSCGGSSTICCPGGVPATSCGPLVLDLTLHAGDAPRLEIAQRDASTLDVTVRSRDATASPLPVTLQGVGSCSLTGDTTHGSYPDVALSFAVTRSTVGGTPHLLVSSPGLTRLEAADLALSGTGANAVPCYLASTQIGSQLGTLSQQLADGSVEQIAAELCAACPCAP